MLQVSIIIPFIHRDTIQNAINAIHSNINLSKDEYEIISVEDIDRIGVARMVDKLVKQAKSNIICYLCDETLAQPGFMIEALKVLNQFKNQHGFVRLNGQEKSVLSRFWIANKSVLQFVDGHFFHKGYKHGYGDNELQEIMQENNVYRYAPKSIILHDDDAHLKSKRDTVYQRDNVLSDFMLYLKRKIDRKSIRLGIGIPLTDQKVYSQFFDSWVTMEKPSEFVYLKPVFPGPIAAVRNEIVKQALSSKCTHLIFLDTDQIYPTNTISKLLSYYKLPMVGALVHRRYPPFDPILYKGDIDKFTHIKDSEWLSGKLIDVDATGGGCFIVRCDILAQIGYPWFVAKDERNGDNETVGEDIYFSRKIKQYDYKIYVDTSIKIKHLGLMEIDIAAYMLYKKYGTDKMASTIIQE